jgi:hypothetical protein
MGVSANARGGVLWFTLYPPEFSYKNRCIT